MAVRLTGLFGNKMVLKNDFSKILRNEIHGRSLPWTVTDCDHQIHPHPWSTSATLIPIPVLYYLHLASITVCLSNPFLLHPIALYLILPYLTLATWLYHLTCPPITPTGHRTPWIFSLEPLRHPKTPFDPLRLQIPSDDFRYLRTSKDLRYR